METEVLWSYGAFGFLKERFTECSDNYRVFICKKCKSMANVNPDRNVYHCRGCGNETHFSQIRIPYAAKLLFQEIQALAIDTKFTTN